MEGHGDAEAVRVLVRRVAQSLGVFNVEVTRSYRIPRSKLVRPGELERAVELVVRTAGEHVRILIVLDADDDLPCELGPKLLRRAAQARPDVLSTVVLANKEMEAWFIAGIESLRGVRGIASDASPAPNPEAIRGAKGWLSAVMLRPYSEVTDQVALAARVDLGQARRAPSFNKLIREIGHLLDARLA